jgi:YihY family inner membrane protein
VGDAIGSVTDYARKGGGGSLATLFGMTILFFGATSVFAQLQDALNTIWGVKPADETTWTSAIKDRLWSFAVVLGIGFLLLVSLVLSAALAAAAQFLTPSTLPGGAYLWQALNWFVSFGLVALLFALIYKLLPDAQIEWSDVWVGAAVTALLFACGKYLIGLYLGRSTWISAYGAAGSLVVVLLWVYYSSQIFLFGAEFTYVYANQAGKPLRPKRNAEPVTEEARARQGMARRALPDPPPAPETCGSDLMDEGWPALHWLRAYWERIQASYWFLPAVMTAAAAALAFATVRVDEGMQYDWVDQLGWIYTRGPDGARAVLSTIAGSMITVAGVVFSVTIVALSLASNQFGPRLLRNFMRDRGNQIVLGTFVATYVYCLLVKRTVQGVDGSEFVPHISVTVAILMAVASLGVLIYFIHHVAVSIQAPELIANVAHELHEAIDRLFPEELGYSAEEEDVETDELPSQFDRSGRAIGSPGNGYVQAVDGDQLLKLACQAGVVIRVRRRPGDFVVKRRPLAIAWPEQRVDEKLAGRIRNAFLLGPQQTPTQDAEYAVDQLVQVAVRALSPGINDPFTAATCLDRLGESLCHLAGRKLPSAFRRDADGALRVIANPLTFAEVADTAFRQIRQYGSSNFLILARLLDVISEILADTQRQEDRRALLHHARLTKLASASLAEEDQRAAVDRRYRELVQTHGRAGNAESHQAPARHALADGKSRPK